MKLGMKFAAVVQIPSVIYFPKVDSTDYDIIHPSEFLV